MDAGDDAAPSPSIVAKQATDSLPSTERSKTGLPIDWNEEFQVPLLAFVNTLGFSPQCRGRTVLSWTA